MPVSHLGLTVSHIPSATSFFLAALQPLGYHYIGRRGGSVGLGIHDADFFLCQEPNGYRLAPTHIAFAAVDRSVVRDCYAAALEAGAVPSGPPSFRNDDCSCFNAAVIDLDGNTVEFIWRDDELPRAHHGHRSELQGDSVYSLDEPPESLASSYSRQSPTRSRTQTALDLASATTRTAPSVGMTRSRTEPTEGFSSKAVLGTALGAVAGAAIAYAMCQSEREGAREEASYAASMRPRGRASDDRTVHSARRSASAAPTRQSHRNYSVTESRTSRRLPPTLPPTVVRAIDATPYYGDTQVEETFTRYTKSRPSSARSKTYDAVEYAPAPTSSSRFSMRRATTLPSENAGPLLLEAPRSTTSRRSSRRERHEEQKPRHDSVVSRTSTRSRREKEGEKRSSTSQASTIKPSKRESTYYVSAADVPLPQSVAKAASKASTAKAAQASPRAVSTYSTRTTDSAYKRLGQPYSPADAYYLPARQSYPPLASNRKSHASAADVPLPESNAGARGDEEYESDGLGDTCTIVPDDSISCIDMPRAPRSTRSHRSERDRRQSRPRDDVRQGDDRRGESTIRVKARRNSVMTAPVIKERDRDGGRRSAVSYT